METINHMQLIVKRAARFPNLVNFFYASHTNMSFKNTEPLLQDSKCTFNVFSHGFHPS